MTSRLADELVQIGGDFGLGQVPRRLAPDAVATAICGYCSTGCALDVHLRDGRPVNLTPSPGYPVNRGVACPKGWEALAPLASARRATRPLLRGPRGRLEPVSWDRAIDAFIDGVRAVQMRHGPASVAFLGTGQITCEELALLGAVAKLDLGMRHGDGNTRQCMATAVAAYKACFGFDAPPYTYADLERSDAVFVWGGNPAIAHPVLWERAIRRARRPEIVAVDPRMTETAAAATLHLPVRPKSDLALAYGMARLAIERGLVDRAFVDAHTEGFEAFAAHVQPYSLARVAAETGLAPAAIEAATERLGHDRVSIWWTMGVNQSHQGVLTAQALIALALLTGNIGRPGTGANSITGQCNAMGSRLFSNTSSLYGGRDFTSARDRADVAGILGIDASAIPDAPSWPYDRIMEGIASGAIRGLWVVATNTAHSWINQRDAHELLDRLELLVVQDLYADTETARRAHLVLPAAGWGEKTGTFINSERRIGLIERVADPPGEALPDFEIFRRIGARANGAASRPFTSPETTFALLQALTRGRPCDITGIAGYAELRTRGGIQWPHPAGAPPPATERRLFEDGRFFTPTGRARFHYGDPTPPPERASPRFPLTLNTGRGSASQWHTQTRTRDSPLLETLHPATTYVELHPTDAAARRIANGDRVRVESPRGAIQATAVVTPTVQPGHAFIPMHYPEVNQLTFPAFDPTSHQPAYKSSAIQIHRDP